MNAETEPYDETSWADLEAFFGDVVGIIDAAIGQELSSHVNGIRREDFYLASEGLTYAVVVALRDARLTVEPRLKAVR